MPTHAQTVVLTGPNGSGKTRVAAGLAQAYDGELVNLDSVFLYRGFPLVTGLSDTLYEAAGLPRHLYELLDPDEPLPDPADYALQVRDVCRSITARGKLAVVEGGSTTLFPPLYALDRQEPFVARFVVLDAGGDRVQATRRRVELALAQGLLAEVRWGLENHPDSLIMQSADFATPLVDHLAGRLSLPQAIDEIVHLCLEYAAAQESLLGGYRDLVRLPHERAYPEETAGRVAALLGLEQPLGASSSQSARPGLG